MFNFKIFVTILNDFLKKKIIGIANLSFPRILWYKIPLKFLFYIKKILKISEIRSILQTYSSFFTIWI